MSSSTPDSPRSDMEEEEESKLPLPSPSPPPPPPVTKKTVIAKRHQKKAKKTYKEYLKHNYKGSFFTRARDKVGCIRLNKKAKYEMMYMYDAIASTYLTHIGTVSDIRRSQHDTHKAIVLGIKDWKQTLESLHMRQRPTVYFCPNARRRKRSSRV
jgi:hypothetical protein